MTYPNTRRHGNSWDYILDAIKTESNDFDSIKERFNNVELIRLIHASVGLSTEANELMDNIIKKHLFYGKELDKTNIIEEAGDLFWYLAILHDTLGKAFEYAMAKNIEKLKARYGDKFNQEGALKRDLVIERTVLEDAEAKTLQKDKYRMDE
jgi:NTP pyrophosphatase (non-canonical NTP hydrolase)